MKLRKVAIDWVDAKLNAPPIHWLLRIHMHYRTVGLFPSVEASELRSSAYNQLREQGR